MQISALEVARLLENRPAGKKAELEFKEITPDTLPQSVQPDAAEVAKVVEMVKAAPDVREEIVMKLKERIEKGEYEISGEEIADMMIRRMKADKAR